MNKYLKQKLKTDLCLSFANSFSSSSKDSYFLFFGKTTSWDDPENPPVPVDSLREELEAWRNMIAMTQITKNNVYVGARRINWTYNKVFDQYDDTIDLYDETNKSDFYCITDDYNVYKCLNNNYGTPSLFKPTNTGVEEQITEDGYVWKFLFKVKEELLTFLTQDFIPIEELTSVLYSDETSLQNNVKITAIPGSVENVVITQNGGAYPIAVVTDPNDTEKRHKILQVVDSTTFKLTATEYLSRVSDIYNDYYELYIAEGPGAGQKSVITDYTVDGEDIQVDLQTALVNITTNSVFRIYPRISITGDGSDASVIPVLNENNIITGFSVINSGKNYKYADVNVYRKNPTYQTKTLARAIISPIRGHGYDAMRDLGADMLMIDIPVKNEEKVAQKNALNLLANEYAQIGIVKNILENNDNYTQLVTPNSVYQQLKLENINASVVLYVESENLNVSIGSILKQGPDTNLYQARGIVTNFENILGNNYKLTLTATNGRFLPTTSSSYDLIKENSDGTETTISQNITQVDVDPSKLYTNLTFASGNFAFGISSNTTATVKSWTCDPYGLSGILEVQQINGQFINSYYTQDTSGNPILVKGETVIGYISVDPVTGQFVFPSSSIPSGIITSITSQQGMDKTFLKVSYTFRLNGTVDANTFAPDMVIKNNNGDYAKIVSYTYKSGTGETSEIEVNYITGNVNLWSGSSITIVEENGTEEIVSAVVVSQIIEPEVKPYYGDMIYIQNVIPVVSANDTEEQVKILIKF